MLGDSHKEVHMVRNREWHMLNTGQQETEALSAEAWEEQNPISKEAEKHKKQSLPQ